MKERDSLNFSRPKSPGTKLLSGDGQSWSLYWKSLNAFQLLWINKFNGDNLLSEINCDVITVTGKDFITTSIPDTIATFAVPDTDPYKLADAADHFWFNEAGVRQQKTFEELIESSTSRTFVKYTDFDPYTISAIGVLNPDFIITDALKIRLNRDFKLWVLYCGEMMDSGYMKDNRILP